MCCSGHNCSSAAPDHCRDLQVFDDDDAVVLGDHRGCLVHGVLPPPGVSGSNLATLRRALRRLREPFCRRATVRCAWATHFLSAVVVRSITVQSDSTIGWTASRSIPISSPRLRRCRNSSPILAPARAHRTRTRRAVGGPDAARYSRQRDALLADQHGGVFGAALLGKQASVLRSEACRHSRGRQRVSRGALRSPAQLVGAGLSQAYSLQQARQGWKVRTGFRSLRKSSLTISERIKGNPTNPTGENHDP